MRTRQKSDAAVTAKVIKKRLTDLYPMVRFSVTSDIFSMGDSVSIGWTDGPLTEEVEKITKQYQHGSYDSMEEIYNYCDIDPSLGCQGAKYVQCSRSISPEYKERIQAKAYEHYGDFEPNNNSTYRKMLEIEKLFFPYPVAEPKEGKTECIGSSIISGLDYKIIEDVDTRDNSVIFVVKVITKVDDFGALNLEMQGFGGYYSRFKKGFIFKEDPTEKLKGEAVKEEVGTPMSPDAAVDVSASGISSSDGVTLLDKFDAVEVRAADRFPPDDMRFCSEQEETYKEAHALYLDIYEKAQAFSDTYEKGASIGRKYVSKYGGGGNSPGLSQYHNSIVETNQGFMDIICAHFRKKYNVSLETPKWEDLKSDCGVKRTEPRIDIVPLDFVLESIHQQMGGMTFDEKALDEIKRKMKQCVINEYSKKWKMAVVGAKLVVDDFYSSSKSTIYKEYEITIKEQNTAFYEALTHFEYNSAYLHQKYNKYTGHYTIREKTGIYDKHPVLSSVISSIKIFKNGKVEFEFVDSNKAWLFARKYCGYNELQSA